MKTTDLHAFDTQLRSWRGAPLFLVVTPDPFDGERALRSLLRWLGEEGSQSVQLEGEEVTLDVLTAELENRSLFCKRSVVVVRSVEKLRKPVLERLERGIGEAAEDLVLILLGSSLPSTSPLVQGVSHRGLLLQIAAEKPWNQERHLVDWVRNEARHMGKDFEISAAQLLVERVGSDKRALYSELEKLASFSGDRPSIVRAEVESLTSWEAESQVWELGRAVVQRKLQEAVDIANRLGAQGGALPALLAHLRSQFQTGLRICTLLRAGGQIAPHFPQYSPKRLERVVEEARSYGGERYRRGLLSIYRTEQRSRAQQLSEALLLERLLVELVV